MNPPRPVPPPSRSLHGTLAVLAVLAAMGCGATEPEVDDQPLLDDVPDYLTLLGQTANHAILMEPGGRFLNIVQSRSDSDALREGAFGPREAVVLSRLAYERVEDRFDFLIFTFDPREPHEVGPSEFYIRVASRVSGLNMPLTEDDGRTFGTTRLQGVFMLQSPQNVVEGPLLHEIAHQWGQTLVIPMVSFAHWGLAGVGGQLGGWSPGTVEELEDGLFRAYGPTGLPFGIIANDGNRPPYAPWELYIMGLLPPDSLPPLEIAAGGTVVDSVGGVFRADSIVVREPWEILPSGFPRKPAWPDAPTHFTALFVVMSAEPLDQLSVSHIVDRIEAFTTPGDDGNDEFMNFWEATAGRGTFEIGGLLEARR